MREFMRALREGFVAGSIASVASAVVLAWAGRRENRHAAAPINAVSHWLWDRESFQADEPSLRHTLTGYAVHHGASIFWGTVHAAAWGAQERNKRPAAALAGAAAAAALACFVDYHLTPRRLTPGFEQRLSTRSLALVYASFGLGLAAGSMAMAGRITPQAAPAAAPTRRPGPAN
jgi:hypothetical protein